MLTEPPNNKCSVCASEQHMQFLQVMKTDQCLKSEIKDEMQDVSSYLLTMWKEEKENEQLKLEDMNSMIEKLQADLTEMRKGPDRD